MTGRTSDTRRTTDRKPSQLYVTFETARRPFFDHAVGWNSEWFPVPGQYVFDRERQRIAAISRTPNHLDLFVIGLDNHVWTTFWPNAFGQWNNEWFPVPGQHVFDRERQRIAAVSRTPEHLDLFVIGLDNHVWTTFWNS